MLETKVSSCLYAAWTVQVADADTLERMHNKQGCTLQVCTSQNLWYRSESLVGKVW